MRTITLSNNKGGSGKTTTTVSLAAAFAERGLRVLVVDLDPQGSATEWLGGHEAPTGLVEFAAVFGRPHHLLGHEIWAAVTLKTDDAETRAELTRYAREAMTPAMLPRQYLYKEALPRTTTGKVDYPALLEEAAARAGS